MHHAIDRVLSDAARYDSAADAAEAAGDTCRAKDYRHWATRRRQEAEIYRRAESGGE